jgi:periplasmic copper chaperone A
VNQTLGSANSFLITGTIIVLQKPIFIVWVAVLLASSVTAAEPTIRLEGAWVRALPPTQRTTAGYVSVVNESDKAETIVGARTSVSATTEIHVSREVDGYMRMEQLKTLDLPAGGRVELAPGGIHLMLLGMAEMPAPGTAVDLCLMLESGREVCADATVQREPDATTHSHHQHH